MKLCKDSLGLFHRRLANDIVEDVLTSGRADCWSYEALTRRAPPSQSTSSHNLGVLAAACGWKELSTEIGSLVLWEIPLSGNATHAA